MFFKSRGLVRPSFGVTLVAYAVGILLAGTVTALGAYRVATAIVSELALSESRKLAAAGVLDRPLPNYLESRPAPSLRLSSRQAFMTPLHGGLATFGKEPAASASRVIEPAFFGSSSRYWGRSSRRDRDSDDEEENRSREAGTYRTMCVRLCDGYYFPISFSATRDRFGRDAKTCESSCGGQARLFVYRNPGADVEDMVDLRGQPYRKLNTAFLYRTEYVPACRCKPNPWDAEAQERHRMYALAAAKLKGNKQAAAELEALTAKVNRDRSVARSAAVAVPVEAPAETVQAPPNADRVRVANPTRSDRADDKTGRMGLGARTSRERAPRTSGRDSEWMARALGRNF
jgi:hypothetical protein